MTTCSFWTDFAGIKAKTVTEMIILTAIISHFSVWKLPVSFPNPTLSPQKVALIENREKVTASHVSFII